MAIRQLLKRKVSYSIRYMSITKPFLKWVGGKTQILKEVLGMFPSEICNYHEPFLGGGSVLLGFLSYVKSGKITLTGKVYASDVNANLIALYKNIQERPRELIAEVKKLTGNGEEYYYEIRTRFNTLTGAERSGVAASAMMLFLNKHGFRGMYREGPKGINVPYGNYKNPQVIDEEHILSVSELIKGVEFAVCSFTESLPKVRRDGRDFVYLDPPYAPEAETSFVGYTAGGFDAEKHKALFKLCNDLVSGGSGVKMLMSNADVLFVKEAFPTPLFRTVVISCRRAINSKNPESRTNEVLIAN